MDQVDGSETADRATAGAQPARIPPERLVDSPVAGVPSDNTSLVGILASLAESGYPGQFIPHESGALECTNCGSSSYASMFVAEQTRRLEGASDPDDLVKVVAAHCPACGAGGTAVLGYGVNASGADVAAARAIGRSENPVVHVPAPEQHGDSSELFNLYLRDHHAASTAGVALAQRCRSQNLGTPYEPPLTKLIEELEGERRVIVDILGGRGSAPSRMKPILARLVEAGSRLKANGRVRSYSPLSRLVELEGLAAGITSKRQMWRSFAAIGDEGWTAVDGSCTREQIDELTQQATRQLDMVIGLHAEAGRVAFGPSRA